MTGRVVTWGALPTVTLPVWVSATEMSAEGAGATAQSIGSAPDIVHVITLAKGPSPGGGYFVTEVPDLATGGPVNMTIVWSAPPGTGTGVLSGVFWSADSLVLVAGQDPAGAGATMTLPGQPVPTSPSSRHLLIEAPLQVLSAASPGSQVRIDVRRLPTHSGDNFGLSANLVGVRLDFLG
jgi:hypothetical protein